MSLSVSVDKEVCCAYGNCVMLCPDVFELGDEAQTVSIIVDSIPAGLEESVREAVRDCPSGALSSTG